MKKLFLAVLLLIQHTSWSQSGISWTQSNIDSLKNLLATKSLQAFERVDVLNDLAYQTRRVGPELSLNYAINAFDLAKNINYKRGEATANVLLCLYHYSKGAFEKSVECGLSAIQDFDSLEDKKGLMNSYLVIGYSYTQLKEKKKANEYIKNSLAIALELGDNIGAARAYNCLGSLNQNEKNISNQDSRELFLKALDYSQNHEDEPVMITVLGNIADTYLRDGDPEKAKPFLEKGLMISGKHKFMQGEIFIHLLFGRYFRDVGLFSKAEEHFLLGEKLAKQCGEMNHLLSIYLELIELKINAGKNREAYDFHVKYSRAMIILFDTQKAHKIAALEAKFETEKKEKAIYLLQQEKEIQKIWQNVLIVGSLLVILGSYLIFLLQRSRTRKAKKLFETERILNDKLKEVDELKSSFYANISHEFRTPLTLILAPLETELKKESSPEAKDNLLLMRRSADRLLDLINQLLDLSKLESGKMNLQVKQGDMGQFLSMTSKSFDTLAQKKKIEFIQNVNIVEGQYWYDQDKVEKIMTNLLSNAFKFTPVGGVVTIAVLSLDATKLNITVSDTGAGIPKEEQTNVFLPFYRTRQTSNFQGTGLGLSLVRELVKLYSGTIELLSTPGVGTSFSVLIPVNKESFSPDQVITDNEFISQK